MFDISIAFILLVAFCYLLKFVDSFVHGKMSNFKQDLPPPGGFKSVRYERVPLKKYMPATFKWLGLFATLAYGTYCYAVAKTKLRWESIERRAAYLSVLPLILAEYDRARLKTYRKFRDEEAELMKDVEGWKVGCYKGEPIYKSVKPDEWYDPRGSEPWIYARPRDFEKLYLLAMEN